VAQRGGGWSLKYSHRRWQEVGRWSPRKTVVGKHMMAARIKTDKNI
jgi:hypothetical protein